MERAGLMRIVGEYSFNKGNEFVGKKFPRLLEEIRQVIQLVDAARCRTKTSEEKIMPGRVLYDPRSLNKAFKREFSRFGWHKQKVVCDYPTKYYTADYRAPRLKAGAFREMDFVKDKLGVEVQFGKYAFMVYNVCAKMTIFNKLGYITAGVEIVPIKEFAEEMSTGVSYFEQFVWDLEQRGVSDIDIPVLILGITDSRPVAHKRASKVREQPAPYMIDSAEKGLFQSNQP
jgi:hypothetical protein